MVSSYGLYGLYGRSYGLYGQLLQSLRWAWPYEIFAQEQKTRTVSTVMLPVSLRSPDYRNRVGSVIQA